MADQNDALAILKLYELRTEDKMRDARKWFFSEFQPESAADILALYQTGERASANFRMVVSYWDMAASLALEGAISETVFLKANTEHIFVYAKVEAFLDEVRKAFGEEDYLASLEALCKKMPDFEVKLEGRKRLIGLWNAETGG